MRMQQSLSKSWVMAAAALTTIGLASVANADEVMTAKVPFSFIVAGSRLPAGNYLVREASDDPAIVSIASKDGKRFMFALSTALTSEEPRARPELVFEKLGNQYFLARVLLEDRARGLLITTKQVERGLESAAVDP